MPTIFRNNGKLTEITWFEKEPPKIHLYSPRKRHVLFGARRPDNARRTRQICVRRVFAGLAEFGTPLLVTLTFKGDASDASYANDSLRVFQVRLRSKYPKAESLFVPELSPRGRIHFHGLIFNVPLSLGDTRQGGRTVSIGDERKTRILAGIWGEGYVDATKTDGSGKLAYYISKYVTKSKNQVMFNAMRLLRISRGFPADLIIRNKFADYLAERYSVKKPAREFSREHQFLGQVTKKTYIQGYEPQKQ
ncbi:MAG: Uncharacterized protein LiPW15_88 [Parcubacteria group bacterium LiPW_15]|nr:MAG: Uncharacterized protein LiPW15_88 [Parcubacteria group bacterium LiPW_15]